MEDVRREDRRGTVERHAVVDDLGLVGRVDRLGGDLGDAADPEGPVGALDDGGRRVDLGREERLHEVRVGAVAAAEIQPRSPACGAVDASVETVLATSSHDLPPWRSLSAASALVLASAVWAAVGVRLPRSTVGLDLDHPGVAGLGGRRLLGQTGVDLLGRRADTFLARRASPGAWRR